ncbi:GABA-specific permease [Cyberlindnera fabianii]|uniref:GABA-specific permease n=1 Tax=Cyberlindnera fabianii TaxID=36022 RepID=A0A1V2L7I8_CYBFA|nr:GABA-specific permease [Cyberlindnera fabianii]
MSKPQLTSVLSSGLRSITSHAINTDLEATKSQIRDVHTHTAIDTRAALNQKLSDDEILALAGYKHELRRQFGPFNMIGVAFSIMSVLPSLASVLGYCYSINGALWGWFVSSFFIFLIGVCMSELASAIPTAGGLYYWTYHYSPDNCRIWLSFLVGTLNTLSLASGLCSIDYGFSKELLSIVYIAKDGDFNMTDGIMYGVFAACIVSHIITASIASYGVAKLQSVSVFANVTLVVFFIIVMLVGTKNKNDAKWVFTDVENFTDWPTGWAWVYNGFMPAIWTIGAFDSCVHMSEEAHNATKNVPIGILGSISSTWFFGFIILIVCNFCVSKDIQSILTTPSGQPMAQLIFDALGKKWTIVFMVLIAVCQWLMGVSIITATSRQAWAFSRDNGLPFSSFLRVVNKRLQVPIRAIFFTGSLALIIGLLCLIGSTAANAVFTLAICGNYFAWGTPIVLKLYRTWCSDIELRFKPGAFYLGDKVSPVVSIITVFWMVFVIIMSLMPSTKSVDKETMNYTVVVVGAAVIMSMTWFFTIAHKTFQGPRNTLDGEVEMLESGSGSDKIDGQIASDEEKN